MPTSAPELIEFYDSSIFNHDTFDVNDHFTTIAEIYFRLDNNMIAHSRIEYGFSDLLGDIGGTAELLVKISAFLFSGYLSFNSSIEIMKDLYSCDDEIDSINE